MAQDRLTDMSVAPVVDLLEQIKAHARHSPEKPALIFHDKQITSPLSLNYADLFHIVCQLSSALQKQDVAGKLVVLAYPSGLEFVSAFLAVLAAGAIAVPASVGNWATRKRANSRLQHILKNSGASFCIAPRAVLENIRQWLPEELNLISDEEWRNNQILNISKFTYHPEQPAYLQYSSGSTLEPKAVIISHRNLAWNCVAGNQVMQYDEQSISLCWMPHFHDYALVNGICQPLYCGAQVHLMSPDSFLRRPQYWLELIDQYRVSHSGAPNFAWRYCVEHVDVAVVKQLDLSCWRFAHCAAEPIQRAVMQRFVAHFAAGGFHPGALHSCYGLAESVAFVTSGSLYGDSAWREVPDQPASLAANCGKGEAGLQLRIVNPDSRADCAENEVGEIWLRHSSVGAGYWQLPELTRQVFQAFNASGDGPFLRTGDLGFLHQGDLFICGRCKDLLIVNGQNFYPHDVEAVAQSVDSCLRADAGVAFQTQASSLVLVQELTGSHSEQRLGWLAEQIRQHVSEQLALHRLDEIVFIRPGSLDKTSSGKVMRRRTAQRWQEKNLAVLWQQALPEETTDQQPEVTDDLTALLIQMLGVQPEQLTGRQSLLNLGLDSLSALRLQEMLRQSGLSDVSVDQLFRLTPAELLALPVQVVTQDQDIDDNAFAPFKLTALQAAYWVGRDSGLALGGIGCSYYQEIRLEAEFDQQKLEWAWNKLIERHDCLRLIFDQRNQQQRVLPGVPEYPLPVMPLCGEWERETLRQQMRHQVRSGLAWPLFDVRLSLADGVAHLHFWIDLLLVDAQGILTLLTEWCALYHQPDQVLPAIVGSFRQAVLSGAGQRRSAVPGSKLAAPMLPLQTHLEALGTPRFCRCQLRLDLACWQGLQQKAKNTGVTLNAIMLTALTDVLRLWSQPGDFAVIVTAQEAGAKGRAPGDYTRSFSLLVPGNQPALNFSRRVALMFQRLHEALNQPGSEVDPLNGTGVPVVFTSLLGADGQMLSQLPGIGRTVDSLSMTPQVGLDFQLWSDAQGVMLSLDYVEGLLADNLPDMLLHYWREGLQNLVHQEWQQIGYPELPVAQKARRTAKSQRAIPEISLYQSVERQMRKTPECQALITCEGQLSYEQLRQQVLALQMVLNEMAIQPGQVVALDLQKGWRQVVAVLAVLRAGAIYLPLDRSWPPARIMVILDNAPAACVISDRLQPDSQISIPWRCFDSAQVIPSPEPAIADIDPHSTAYLIYTSGSTGTPKGVAVSHYSALNTILDINQRFAVCAGDRVLGISSLAFDLSVYDIFATLSAGATLLLPPAQSHLDPARLAGFASEQRATVWNSVPALFQLQIDYARLKHQGLPDSLRLVLLSGDWIALDLAPNAWCLNPGLQVVSLGGATEAAIWSCYYSIGDTLAGWVSVPYGYSLNGQSLHVLNEVLADCPDEVTGDLYIGGVGLAQGYWGDAERTAASFIQHPHSGQRLYRTGDRARYRASGLVEFLGRSDRQLKVGGYRIEPGEIESVLRLHKEVSGCVVTGMEWVTGAGQHLVAFIVNPNCQQTSLVPCAGWVKFLQGSLPDYMIPSRFIMLAQLPLTVNGKVDYAQLQHLARDLQGTSGMEMAVHSPGISCLPSNWLDDWLISHLGTDQFDEQASLIGLGLSSLDIMGLATALERHCGVSLRASQLIRLDSLAALRLMLEQDCCLMEEGEL